MTFIPTIDAWSKDVNADNIRSKQLADEEATLTAEIRDDRAASAAESNRHERAALIASGKTPPPELTVVDVNAKLSRLADIRLARELHREKSDKTRLREGKRLCEELKPAYNKFAKTFSESLVAAHGAAKEMTSMESQLRAAGIGFYPTVCNVNIEKVMGWPTDRTSAFAMLLHECVAMSHLKEMPKELK